MSNSEAVRLLVQVAGREPEAALKYLRDSTAPRGQWENSEVHAFVKAMLRWCSLTEGGK